ncbi:MAG: type I secretion system permease/ATPase, partial [Gammaproteobacteria bacterium]
MNMSEVAVEDQATSSELETHELMDCLLLVATLEGRPASAPAVSSGLPLENGKLTPVLFNRAANRAGLASIMLARELEQIPEEVLPAILLMNDGKAVVLSGLDKTLQLAFITDPETQEQTQVGISQLASAYSGHAYYLRPMQQFDSRTP